MAMVKVSSSALLSLRASREQQGRVSFTVALDTLQKSPQIFYKSQLNPARMVYTLTTFIKFHLEPPSNTYFDTKKRKFDILIDFAKRPRHTFCFPPPADANPRSLTPVLRCRPLSPLPLSASPRRLPPPHLLLPLRVPLSPLSSAAPTALYRRRPLPRDPRHPTPERAASSLSLHWQRLLSSSLSASSSRRRPSPPLTPRACSQRCRQQLCGGDRGAAAARTRGGGAARAQEQALRGVAISPLILILTS